MSSSEVPPSLDFDSCPSSSLTTQDNSSSSSFLRFPTPAADERFSSWVQHNTSVANANYNSMSARSEAPSDGESNLGDSTYEFIDTDEESRDGAATESIASTDIGRPDDVSSLVDADQSESEDEDQHQAASVASLHSLDQAVEHAFNTPTIGRSASILDGLEHPVPQSIEFEEPDHLSIYGAGTISVKHTVADIDEQQMTQIIKGMKLQSPPERLVVTIRQTMTKQGLSTREPLRILYLGSHSAKEDIIRKIASSITASVETGKRAQRLRHSSSQLYNVVPISAFGSERTPEIELMHSSQYQIKVESCTSAESLKFEDTPEKPDVIKLIVDDHVSYHSVPEGKEFLVEPSWDLPHIAVFYCSDSDSAEVRQTRTLARKFMNRHGVPSIVISHRQSFDRKEVMALDQHSIHMCLESRDSYGRGIIHQRLPIDLASFLNIDARQMNRNLALLTGLHEGIDASTSTIVPKIVESKDQVKDLKIAAKADKSVSILRLLKATDLNPLLPAGCLLLTVMVIGAFFSGIPGVGYSSVPTISINSKTVSAVSMCTSPTLASSLPVLPKVTSTSALPAQKTSTRTITVLQSSSPNSLSVVQSIELAKLPKAVNNNLKTNKSVCTAEILGEREILIRIPSATKLSWLTKEAMSVNITRNNVTVDTERAYSSDDGIVLMLAKTEAYGLLNISIVTTKKPRVNETFQVDFGTTVIQRLQNVGKQIWNGYVYDEFDQKVVAYLFDMGSKAKNASSYLWSCDQVKKSVQEQASVAGSSMTEAAKFVSIEITKRSAIVSKEVGLRVHEVPSQLAKGLKSLEFIQEPLRYGLLRAQVQSKLLWLQAQGKDAEYQVYQQRANKATRGSEKSKKCGKCGVKKAGRVCAKTGTKKCGEKQST